MTVTLAIECDNDAFAGEAGPEIARILRELADKFDRGAAMGDRALLRDINGHLVGQCLVNG